LRARCGRTLRTHSEWYDPWLRKAFDSFLEQRKLAQSIASPLSTRDEISSSTEGARTASSKAALPASSQTTNGKAVADPVPDEAPSVAALDAWTEA
jgi:DnaJ homolog subfamily C member 2